MRALDLRELRGDRGDFVCQATDPVAVLARGLFQGVTTRGQVGEGAGQFIGGLFRCRKHGVRLGDALVHPRALCLIGAGFALERVFFARQPRQRRLRVRSQAPFALDVGVELDQAAVELGHAVLGARLLAFERLARCGQTLQGGGGLGLGLAHGGQIGGRVCLARGRLGLFAGSFGNHPYGRILGVLGLGQLGIGGDPAQMKQRRLRLADLLGHGAIADRLPRLPFERVHLSGKLIDDVFEPRQVLLRPAQPQFGLVPPHVQARICRQLPRARADAVPASPG